jgi:hypothetical protein
MAEKNKKEKSNNPIDKDTITDIPHLLPYAHTVGGVQIKPIDKGRVKGRAVEAMYDQTEMQLEQIRKQIELLAQQAKNIYDRVNISEDIYLADMSFEPLIGFTYHLYEKKDGKKVLSMVAPKEWGPNPPYTFIATIKMLSDHTWDIIQKGNMD